MDPLAYTARNLGPSMQLASGANDYFRGPAVVYHQPVTLPAEADLTDGDASFSRRPPNGRLYFRNYKNQVVKIDVNGLDQLGDAITKQDDFYVCTAKRYYEYFTGVSVNIRKDPSSMSPVEREHYENVIKAGLGVLKPSHSSHEMIKFIFSTPAFQFSDYRAEAQE
jgi:hypothetical protein